LNAFDNGDVRATTIIMVGCFELWDFPTDLVAPSLTSRRARDMIKYENPITTTQVRRLTPLECEKLQGFPDGWTEGQSDTSRYKQMGNAVAVPVVEWIIQGICDTFDTATGS
jgi:site-specific DNA-cytosine methylase